MRPRSAGLVGNVLAGRSGWISSARSRRQRSGGDGSMKDKTISQAAAAARELKSR